MGASVIGSSTRFLFWHPEIRSSSKVLLHLYLPDPNLIYDKPDQHCSTIYYQFEMERVASFATVVVDQLVDRKSTRLNSSHVAISYAVFCLKKNMAVRADAMDAVSS